jgi:hypothetical protein
VLSHVIVVPLLLCCCHCVLLLLHHCGCCIADALLLLLLCHCCACKRQGGVTSGSLVSPDLGIERVMPKLGLSVCADVMPRVPKEMPRERSGSRGRVLSEHKSTKGDLHVNAT